MGDAESGLLATAERKGAMQTTAGISNEQNARTTDAVSAMSEDEMTAWINEEVRRRGEKDRIRILALTLTLTLTYS